MAADVTVGLLGLGLMGKALALRLGDAKHRVVGYDIDAEAHRLATEWGIHVVASPRGVAEQADVLILSLPDSKVVTEVLWGDDRVGEGVRSGAVVLDTTTGWPADAVANHERFRERGVLFLDVPIVGSSAEVIAGEAVALVGADATSSDATSADATSADAGDSDGVSAAYMPIIRSFAREVFPMGGVGRASQAKLAVNLVLGLNRLVLAEGLAFGARAGLDLPTLLAVMKSSGAYSKVMDTKGTRMIDGRFEPVARLAQHAKDVELIRRLAGDLHLRTPVSDIHAGLLAELIEKGMGQLDNAAIIKAYLDQN